jgi:hypothetical protein
MRYRLERTVNKDYWQLGFQKGRGKVQSCITFGDRRSVENRWSYHGQCVQGLRPRLLTGLYDNVNFGLCDAGHLLEMSDGLGNACLMTLGAFVRNKSHRPAFKNAGLWWWLDRNMLGL